MSSSGEILEPYMVTCLSYVTRSKVSWRLSSFGTAATSHSRICPSTRGPKCYVLNTTYIKDERYGMFTFLLLANQRL